MRTLHNLPERAFEVLAFNKGWNCTKKGWPDFLCFDKTTKQYIAVEVKPRLNGPTTRMKLLKRPQAACLDFFVKQGIQCFVSDGFTLEPYSREKHASKQKRDQSRKARIRRRQGVGGAVTLIYPDQPIKAEPA